MGQTAHQEPTRAEKARELPLRNSVKLGTSFTALAVVVGEDAILEVVKQPHKEAMGEKGVLR